MIMLSTLRLSPVITLLMEYFPRRLSVSHALHGHQIPTGSVSQRFTLSTPERLRSQCCGICRDQIRVHVKAALREAKLQSELEQINHDLDIAAQFNRTAPR
jgi:hypothetical protein